MSEQPSKEQELIGLIGSEWEKAQPNFEVMESWLKDYAKEAKKELIWQMIESWQDARDGDSPEYLGVERFSFLDIEGDLYEELNKIDPKSTPPTTLNQ